MAGNDIVADIIQRLADRLGADVFPPDVMRSVESEIRRDWSGDVYVPASKTHHRNTLILQRYREGKDIEQLATRFGLSARRIRQIINRRKK